MHNQQNEPGPGLLTVVIFLIFALWAFIASMIGGVLALLIHLMFNSFAFMQGVDLPELWVVMFVLSFVGMMIYYAAQDQS